MQEFERESAKMEMTEEMMEDTLDSALAESGDEEESDLVSCMISRGGWCLEASTSLAT